MILLLALSCGGPSEQPDSARVLRRISLDLRGVLPSEAELSHVAAHPDSVDLYRDLYLDDPRLADRMAHLFGERWLTQSDAFEIKYYDYGLAPDQEYRFERSVGEEPLQLIGHVIAEGMPWSTVVTADWTMADEMLEEVWPLERQGGEGWQPATYTDGRPAVGVLATNGLWWRYVTNTSNKNRSRVAVLSNLLLCQDMLGRPVSFSSAPDLLDEEGTAAAIRTDPGCVSCHAAIEPLATAFYGFYWAIRYNAAEMETYHAEREQLGEEYLGVEGAYFGQPIDGLAEVGPLIASDPRFTRCAVETTSALLLRRDIGLEDFGAVDALHEGFVGDQDMKSLIRAITDLPEYRAPTAADQGRATRLVSPDQLESALLELTGFRWSWEGAQQLDNDQTGYRVLLGGIDAETVSSPQRDPSLTWALTAQRLAQAAAGYAVQTELVDGGSPRLFQHVSLDDRPGDAAFDRELASLHWRLLARSATDDELDELSELWTSIEPEGAAAAWAAVVELLLRDPEFLTT